MKICSHQPSFLPWIGFWNKLAQCETLISLEGVNYAHQDYQNRVRVLGAWLVLPVSHETKYGPIKDVRVMPVGLHLAGRSLWNRFMVKRFKYHERLEQMLTWMIDSQETSLCQVNLKLMDYVEQILGLKLMTIHDEEKPNQYFSKTRNLVQHVMRYEEKPVYYAGQGTMEYLNVGAVPFPVCVQRMKFGVSSESILQLIAQETDPLECVLNAATWENVDA